MKTNTTVAVLLYILLVCNSVNSTDPAVECPLRKCVSCAYGYGTDEQGCQTCQCLAEDGGKSGFCPEPSGDVGICIVRCNNDTGCSGDQKCCGGCPRECTDPLEEKPGQCVQPSTDGYFGTCHTGCVSDLSCPGDEKCCGECVIECISPATGARFARFASRTLVLSTAIIGLLRLF